MKIWKILVLICMCKADIVFGTLKTIDKIVALVNHHIILDSDVKNNMYTMQHHSTHSNTDIFQEMGWYQQILDQLITNELIIQINAQKNFNITYKTIDQMINCIADLCGMTKHQFYIYLHNIGLNKEKYYSQQYQDIVKKIICDNIIHHKIDILTHEINDIIKETNNINFDKQFKLRYITLSLPIQPTQNQIDQIEHFAKLLIKEIKYNNNIKKLLHTYFNKKIIQILKVQKTEWISWNEIPIIFDKHLQKTKKGDIIGPILSRDGMHIIEVQDIRYKDFIFPITKVKLKMFGINNPCENINIIKQLSQIKEHVEKGSTTFDIIIKEKSKDTCFNYHEENIIWKDLNDFEPVIQKVLLSLKRNEISVPIRTSYGYYLIQLIDVNILNYTEIMHERAYFYLLDKKFNEIINNWIQELRSTSYIKIIN